MKKIYLLLAVLTSTGLVHAGENPFKPEPKLKDAKVSSSEYRDWETVCEIGRAHV